MCDGVKELVYDFRFMDAIRFILSAATSSILLARFDVSLTNPNRSASSISVSNSESDPLATLRKYKSSFDPLRAAPSAILAGTDTAARRSWLVKPYCSLLGKASVVT